jgi:hypothetical protein
MTDEERAAKKEAFNDMTREEKRAIISEKKEQFEARKNNLMERIEENDDIPEDKASTINESIENFSFRDMIKNRGGKQNRGDRQFRGRFGRGRKLEEVEESEEAEETNVLSTIG